MTIYFISGLGADRTVFQKLRLPGEYVVKYLDWIPPLKRETLQSYAARLAEAIDTSEEYAVVGLSFGGMLAAEIARLLQPRHTILISSAATSNELPRAYKLLGNLRLNHFVPSFLLTLPNRFAYWFFGATGKKERALLKQVFRQADPRFVKWAINAILHWTNKERPANIFHIHGTADRVLPYRLVNADYTIQGGGHLVVFTHAEIISSLIKECIQNDG